MAVGYIFLYRMIEGHWIWQDPQTFKLFAWMLLRAHWEAEPRRVAWKGGVVTLARGQLLATEAELASVAGWASRTPVRRFLALAQADGTITVSDPCKTARQEKDIQKDIDETSKRHFGMLISICKYEDFQAEADAERHRKDIGKTSDETKKRQPLIKEKKEEEERSLTSFENGALAESGEALAAGKPKIERVTLADLEPGRPVPEPLATELAALGVNALRARQVVRKWIGAAMSGARPADKVALFVRKLRTLHDADATALGHALETAHLAGNVAQFRSAFGPFPFVESIFYQRVMSAPGASARGTPLAASARSDAALAGARYGAGLARKPSGGSHGDA